MEVSAIGRRSSLGSFGLSFLGIGITVESFQMSGMVHVSVEVWKRRCKTPLSCSAQNLRVLPQIPSGPGHLFTPTCLNSPNTLSWSITALSSDIKDCLGNVWKIMCIRVYCIHVSGHGPLIFSFLPFLFFNWVGVLWPQLSKVLKPVRWAGSVPFPPVSLQ